MQELAALRAAKQPALQAAERVAPQAPDPESAEALVNTLALLGVDWGPS
jgi:hypothetical protein